MEKVVYLLGAGFSAPLGLPVMSNFLFKSKDMYWQNPEKYDYFQGVFDTIGRISNCKNYYEFNAINVEYVLSILEMGDYLKGGSLSKEFIDYIRDVIEFYTPPIPEHSDKKMPGNQEDYLFGTDMAWYPYAMFACALLNRRFLPSNMSSVRSVYHRIICAANPDAQTQYSVVTLNYDMVLESVANFISMHYVLEMNQAVAFADRADYPISNSSSMVKYDAALAKLHGSVDTGVIIPPTWSKGVNTDIVPAWNLAFRLLAEATQIRIIGYSLPIADAYVKYLLKSAVIQAPSINIKKIDIICLDDDSGSVKKRFYDFIKFDYRRFANKDTKSYLRLHQEKYAGGNRTFDKLEQAHEEFMQAYS